MKFLVQKIHRNTRLRIYVRVLPIVFLAVGAAGAVGWAIYARVMTGNLIAHDTGEVRYLLEAVRSQTLVETLRLEAHRPDGLVDPDAAADFCGQADPLLAAGNLWGVGRVARDPAATDTWHLQALCLGDERTRTDQAAEVRAWFEGRRAARVDEARFRRLLAPQATFRDGDRSIQLLNPLVLDGAGPGTAATALLPVMVRDGADDAGLGHRIYFLRLDRLVDTAVMTRLVSDPHTWWTVLDPAGRVVGSSGLPTVGGYFIDQPATDGATPFAAVGGRALLDGWRPGDPWRNHLVGSRLRPWVVTAGQSDDLPLVVLLGHETRHLMAVSLGYVLVVLGLALLAQAVAVYGVSRVVGPIAKRMQRLAEDMAQVAAGDYTRRIEDASDDEVAYLVRYFNLMADSLDETDRALSEKTRHLETALQNRQLLDRAKDDFLVLISHEVRTPLTAIMGGVDILKSLARRANDEERQLLERLNLTEVLKIVEANGQRLRGFMNDAIQMTTIQSSDQQLNLRPEPIGTLIEMGLCGVREMAQVQGITVQNELVRTTDWQVLCDARILTLAFEKVLKNAVVHNREGGRVVIREVDAVPGVTDLAAETTAEHVHRLRSQESFGPYRKHPLRWRAVEIFNTGEAIPAERCEALFAKFELVGRIEHHQRGSGLSLPIAQSAVEHHGGRIFVHGIRNEGNSFYLLLPTIPAGSGQDPWDRVGGRARYEEVRQMADPAADEVELGHESAGAPGGGH